MSDEFWEKVEPLVPPAPSYAEGGRTRMDDRKAFAAIVYVLRTGIQWNALPRELGASSTVHDRFQEWEHAGFFEELWGAGLAEYDEMEGIKWEWQAIDGVMTKAPLGKDATGKNPTDRAKSGTERSMLTDGAGIAIEGANRHDAKLLVVARPAWEEEDEQQHMCLDAAYDSERVREELKERLHASHPSGRQEGEGARRSRASSRWAG